LEAAIPALLKQYVLQDEATKIHFYPKKKILYFLGEAINPAHFLYCG